MFDPRERCQDESLGSLHIGIQLMDSSGVFLPFASTYVSTTNHTHLCSEWLLLSTNKNKAAITQNMDFFFLLKNYSWGWGCSSVVKCLPNVLGPAFHPQHHPPNTVTIKNKKPTVVRCAHRLGSADKEQVSRWNVAHCQEFVWVEWARMMWAAWGALSRLLSPLHAEWQVERAKAKVWPKEMLLPRREMVP